MNKITSILIIGSFLFTSCEKTELIDVDLENTEQTVIESEILSGQPFKGVKITHTLSINEEYDIKKAEITDAYAYLVINGLKIVPLHYGSKGTYIPLTEIRVTPGDTYELFAEVNGNSVYSITKIPGTPEVLSVNYNNNGYFEATVKASEGEAYGALWMILTNPLVKEQNFHSIEPVYDLSPVKARTNKLDDKYLSNSYNGKRRVQVFSFDKQYSDYFKTKPQIDPTGSGVATGGAGVRWNIKGKNVIGLFIGVAKITLENPL